MNKSINSRTEIVETQTLERGDHFHGHHLPWEMAKVATFGDYTILVWASDTGEIPHFHVIRGRDLLRPEFEACLKIQSAEYYPHGRSHDGRLSEKLLEELVALLQSKDQDLWGNQTLWQALIGDWNRNNEERKVPLTTTMPDYRQLVLPQ